MLLPYPRQDQSDQTPTNVNLQHDATVVTSSYTRDVPFERDNETFNTHSST